MNFIYFNPDELRADVLGCYGHELAETPNFDRLAAEGTRFDECHVQHTVCSPSRCSFLTGRYPHNRGHRTLWNLLQPDEPNTFRYLKEAGYEVHWMGKNDALAQETVPHSITRLHGDIGGGSAHESLFEFGEPGYYSFLAGPMNGPHGDEAIIERAIRFLSERDAGDPPFMLFLATGMPHPTYTVPQPYYDMYDPEDLPPLKPEELADKPSFFEHIRQYRDLDKCDYWVFRKIRAVYLGMVTYVDHLLGRLMDALEDTGLADDTTLFAFSDHGDWAGDYGLTEKWPSGLDDCLTRVPMIVRSPGMVEGHVVEEPMECFDIMPTTLELAGVESDHTHFAHSMIPRLEGGSGDPGRAVYAEGGYDGHEPQCFEGGDNDRLLDNEKGIYFPKGLQQQEKPETTCRATMIRTSEWKLIRRTNGEHELYDLQSDPEECLNLYRQEKYREIARKLEQKMLDWYIHTADVVPVDQDPRGFAAELYE
ncbi:MAG: sulfatase-like hydrolase/transferase [Candidatus Brocadiia bacterium]